MDKVNEPAVIKTGEYQRLYQQMKAVLEGESFVISRLATFACMIHRELPDIYWAGFYLEHEGILKIGPYQGSLGCLTIEPHRGVCGRAFRTRQPQLVENVHDDPEHIACDAASNAEVVIPLFGREGAVYGVLDIDSLTIGRFDTTDVEHLQRMVRDLLEPYLP